MLSRFALIGALTAFFGLDTPKPESGYTGAMQLYGYVLVMYESPRLSTVKYVSQVVGYCSAAKDPVNSLESQADNEAALLEGQGQLNRPLGTRRTTSFNGGNTSRSSAEKSRQWWVRRGGITYETGLDAIYYPVKVCKW
jgi:hypothetical protein